MTKKSLSSVTQYHFTSWPDFGVARSTHAINELVKTVRNDLHKGNFCMQRLLEVNKKINKQSSVSQMTMI